MTFNNANCQIGQFCWDDFMINMCYTFKEDNQFEYLDVMCVAIEEGKGTFSISGDTISFSYEPMPFFLERYSIEKIGALKDKVRLHIKVIDYDSKAKIENFELKHLTENDLDKLVPGISFFDLYKNVKQDAGSYSVHYDGSTAFFYLTTEVDDLNYSNANFTIDSPGIYNVVLQMKKGRARDDYVMKEGEERYLMSMKKDSLILEDLEHGSKIYFKLKAE